eukprot:scaffold23061_cov116-Isochrysis_galbana.AAC.6
MPNRVLVRPQQCVRQPCWTAPTTARRSSASRSQADFERANSEPACALLHATQQGLEPSAGRSSTRSTLARAQAHLCLHLAHPRGGGRHALCRVRNRAHHPIPGQLLLEKGVEGRVRQRDWRLPSRAPAGCRVDGHHVHVEMGAGGGAKGCGVDAVASSGAFERALAPAQHKAYRRRLPLPVSGRPRRTAAACVPPPTSHPAIVPGPASLRQTRTGGTLTQVRPPHCLTPLPARPWESRPPYQPRPGRPPPPHGWPLRRAPADGDPPTARHPRRGCGGGLPRTRPPASRTSCDRK